MKSKKILTDSETASYSNFKFSILIMMKVEKVYFFPVDCCAAYNVVSQVFSVILLETVLIQKLTLVSGTFVAEMGKKH